VGRINAHRFCPLTPRPAQEGLHASPRAPAVARARRPGASGLTQAHGRPRPPRPAVSPLAPCTPDMVRLRARYPSAAAPVCPRLGAPGLTSRSGRGQAEVHPLRPRRPAAGLTLAWAPGECAQVDGGSLGTVPGGHTQRPLRFFVMGLGSRRMLAVAFPGSQTMAHCRACHPPACDGFGGMPPTGMVAKRTAAVLQWAGGEAPVLHPQSLDCARPHGLTITPCPVGQGTAKGRVANGGGSVKKHGLAGLALPDCSARPPAARPWLDTGAQVRRHGETHAPPPGVWPTERPPLRPVPLPPGDSAPVAQGRASRPWRMTVEPKRSAGPAQSAGPALTRPTSPERLGRSPGAPRRARHGRRYERCQALEAPEHPTPLLAQRNKARDDQLFRRVRAWSPRAEADALQLEARRLNPPQHVRTMVAWSALYAPAAVARAREAALVYATFSCASMANLGEQPARGTPEARALPLPRRGTQGHQRRPSAARTAANPLQTHGGRAPKARAGAVAPGPGAPGASRASARRGLARTGQGASPWPWPRGPWCRSRARRAPPRSTPCRGYPRAERAEAPRCPARRTQPNVPGAPRTSRAGASHTAGDARVRRA